MLRRYNGGGTEAVDCRYKTSTNSDTAEKSKVLKKITDKNYTTFVHLFTDKNTRELPKICKSIRNKVNIKCIIIKTSLL